MSYNVVRCTDRDETCVAATEATVAIRVLRDWAAVYPFQQFVIRDDCGQIIAYRKPHCPLPGIA